MYDVRFADGTVFEATAVEEDVRPDANGAFSTNLTVENSSYKGTDTISSLKAKLTGDALKSIGVTINGQPAVTYTDYPFVKYLTSRVQSNGKILMSLTFSKEDPFM